MLRIERTVKQPAGSGLCLLACCATLTNRSFEEVYGELEEMLETEEKAFHLNNPRYLPMRDACQYLLTHNILLGGMFVPDMETCSEVLSEWIRFTWKSQSAVVHTKSKSRFGHAVIWDAEEGIVRDPSSEVTSDMYLADYRVASILPITELI